jgi:ergothioneine biosynthesis protein EgtB
MTQELLEVPSQAAGLADYRAVRAVTERLCAPLEPEDYQLQATADASPAKWHLAHTTWFFETFLLAPFVPSYRAFHPSFNYLFNSYYEAAGPRHPRPRRGLLSRPTVRETYEYRGYVDAAVEEWLRAADLPAEALDLLQLGLNHEQQHQELLLTDLKAAFACNPLYPAYSDHRAAPMHSPAPARWVGFAEGVYEIGHAGDGFAFDVEGPRHRVYLNRFELAGRLVTVGEYRAFTADGGYRRPELWLSDGWAARQRLGWESPEYWLAESADAFTLAGVRQLDDAEPVCHVSFYEADAFARWAGCRLPTEAEWEAAATGHNPRQGTFLDGGALHPRPASGDSGLSQLFGDAWQWTASPYVTYPGFRPTAGAVGEYNGKFACNQMVLRGGSCVTPRGHVRATYRNFFPPEARWQFTGIRLAR